jgi:nicotinamidase-related amidase
MGDGVPVTMRAMAGLRSEPPPIAESIVVVIDAQREYVDGRMPLPDIDPAVESIARILAAAREAGTPIVHVAHQGRPGGTFAPGEGGVIIERVAPIEGESVVGKRFPNAFADTELGDVLAGHPDRSLVLCGFMTHMCVSSTARAALDRGLDTTVIADACATRPLPALGTGDAIPAATLHQVALTELADRFSVVTDAATYLSR